MLNDIQSERIRLKNSKSYSYIKSKYTNSKIYIGNFGYVIVSNNKSEKVIKLYTKEKYFLSDYNNYNLLKNHGILTPIYYNFGNIDILGEIFYYLEFENIRKYSSRLSDIKEISPSKIGKLLSKLHSIEFNNGRSLLHSNLHISNFFVDEKGNLGIFDLVSMIKTDIEYEFAFIYIGSSYDDNFIESILDNYSFIDYFNIDRMYKYVIIKLSEIIKYSVSIGDKERGQFKIDLLKIRSKIKK